MTYASKIVFAMAITLGMVSAANADPITIEISSLASGSVGGSQFSNSLVTFVGVGDTNNVEQNGALSNLIVDFSVTFEVEGLGSGQFTDSIQAVSNSNSELGGLGNTTNEFGLVFIFDSAFENYDLQSDLGPVSGPAVFVFNVPHATTLGDLRISAGVTGTYTATVSGVPEPSAVLVFVSFGSILTFRRRR